ncbi:MAG: hypothetical protein ACXW39_07300, partial [Nitrospira sp.]
EASGRAHPGSRRHALAGRVYRLIPKVSVVVSIQARTMFAEARKMFSNARDAEQYVLERQAS